MASIHNDAISASPSLHSGARSNASSTPQRLAEIKSMYAKNWETAKRARPVLNRLRAIRVTSPEPSARPIASDSRARGESSEPNGKPISAPVSGRGGGMSKSALKRARKYASKAESEADKEILPSAIAKKRVRKTDSKTEQEIPRSAIATSPGSSDLHGSPAAVRAVVDISNPNVTVYRGLQEGDVVMWGGRVQRVSKFERPNKRYVIGATPEDFMWLDPPSEDA